MKTEREKSAQQQELLFEQKQAVDSLIEKCGSIERVAILIGVSTDSIVRWRNGRSIARDAVRQRLFKASNQSAQSFPPSVSTRGGSRPRSDIRNENRQRVEDHLRKIKLAPANIRATTLRALLKRSGLTITDMARQISIHENTLKDYLNPRYQSLMTLSTSEKLELFKRNLTDGLAGRLSLNQRLHAALVKLLGEELVAKGFYYRDLRRTVAAAKISDISGLHERTVRRYLPPTHASLKIRKKIPLSIVENFEKAASELGNVFGVTQQA